MYRVVQTNIWLDDTILSMSPEQKSWFMFLHVNPYAAACGIYKLHLKTMSFQMGYQSEPAENALVGLCGAFPDFVAIDWETMEVGLLQYPKQTLITASKKIMSYVEKEIESIESQYLLRELIARNSATISKPYLAQLRRLQAQKINETKFHGDLPQPPDNQHEKRKEKEKEENNTTTLKASLKKKSDAPQPSAEELQDQGQSEHIADPGYLVLQVEVLPPLLETIPNEPGVEPGETPRLPHAQDPTSNPDCKKNPEIVYGRPQAPIAGDRVLIRDGEEFPPVTAPPREELRQLAADLFEPNNTFGYIASEAKEKLLRFFQEDECLAAEARMGGRGDIPLEVLRDLLRRFTTHANFPGYARKASAFNDLRMQFLGWIKGEKVNKNLAYFSGAELRSALAAKKPADYPLDRMDEVAEKYKAWVKDKQLSMEAMTAEEMAVCLITASEGKKFWGCLDFMASRRDFMKTFRRQYEAWREAWKEYSRS